MTRYVCELRDLVSQLQRVLDELMASDLERRPFVIVEDSVTRKFVQFARRYKPKTGDLLFDVPLLSLTLLPCPSTREGAVWAQRTMRESFGLPDVAIVSITVDGDPAN